MKCLFCGKKIAEEATLYEQENGWHRSCIRKFFGTEKIPEIDLSDDLLNQLAEENVNHGYTVPGVQRKLSLHLSRENTPRLTLVGYPSGYILKPQTKQYRAVPEAEHLVMTMAKKCGIKTVPFSMVQADSDPIRPAYITRRVDRIFSKKIVEKLAMEDFCQLDGRLTRDKYHGSYERCAKIIQRYSSRPGLDLSELFLRLVFCFISGNSDMHLKNFSLIETAPGCGEYVLSDAYDLLPTNLIIPEDQEQFALTMNGKKRNLHRKDFMIFARTADIPEKTAENMMQTILSKKDQLFELCEESGLPADMKTAMCELMEERFEILFGA